MTSAMGSLTILYAEDYRLLLHYVKEMLEEQGWRVETCADGLSALERIEGGDNYDLLLLDNSLPGMSGLELVRRARSLIHRRLTPIIMFSASDFALAASRAGVNAFLKKPDEIDALIETVRRLMSERLKQEQPSK
jgi:two-component system chemotaxis sensor kinase CheA